MFFFYKWGVENEIISFIFIQAADDFIFTFVLT